MLTEWVRWKDHGSESPQVAHDMHKGEVIIETPEYCFQVEDPMPQFYY
jgi:hypothetical protein